MMNEYYGAPSTPNDDFLAHYGVKGMKWGVRRALARGSDRALGRQYRKAQKKLAKLEKLGANGKKYAKRAAAYGAGAAAAGGLAAAGTHGVSNAMRGLSNVTSKAALGIGQAASGLSGAMQKANIRGAGKVKAAGQTIQSLGLRGATGIGIGSNAVKKWGDTVHTLPKNTDLHKALYKSGMNKDIADKISEAYTNNVANGTSISNNTLARVGAGAVGVGLGAAAARNAYRAATAKKHAAQAQQFRKEMNKAFAGTKYANGAPSKSKKRRRG